MTLNVQKIGILGATGTIGRAALDIIGGRKEAFHLTALTAHSNAAELAKLALLHKPEMVVLSDEGGYKSLKDALSGSGIRIAVGVEGLIEAATMENDCLLAAIVGGASLAPTLSAIGRAKKIALASKEALVMAGPLVMGKIAASDTVLLPVDSEHNAIFQVFDSERKEQIEKITLTASGGPFFGKGREELVNITPEQAKNHPNWVMGPKISVDSATMVNKALELIEAAYLFDLPEEKIDVVIHPQQIIHGLVAYQDGSVLAQLGSPDMRIPLNYCLFWPERHDENPARLNMADIAELTFFPPSGYPALSMAREALRKGGNQAILFNAANEMAVDAFLKKKIPFLAIIPAIMQIMELQSVTNIAPATSLKEIQRVDALARQKMIDILEKIDAI